MTEQAPSGQLFEEDPPESQGEDFQTQGDNDENRPLDAGWYERFERVGSFQAYEYLDGDKSIRERQKDQFISGEKENPVLDYPKLDIEKLDRYEIELMEIKADVLTGESNETVKQVYRWRLNEKIAEVRMLKATANGDMRKFKRYCRFVYG
jgi:hypothetical protein